MTGLGACVFCGKGVAAAVAAYPVTGWEFARSGGGANAIHGRRRVPGRIAHQTCAQGDIRRRARGIDQGQLVL